MRQRLTRFRAAATELISEVGWAVIGGILVLGIPGLIWGWDEMRTAALILLLLLAIAVVWTLGRARVRASLELGNHRVHVGQTATGRVAVVNPEQRTSTPTLMEVRVGRNDALFRLPSLAPEQEHEEIFQVPTRRRAVIQIGPVRSVRTDPLGLLHRRHEWAPATELFVHPETAPLETRSLGFLRDVEGIATQNLSSSDVSFHALRDYVPGDDRRSIHWRTTARMGRLIVRQFEETMRAHLLLLLSLDPKDYRDAEDFELAVSVLGSIGRAAVNEGRELTVMTSRGTIEFGSGMGLLDQLCRVELDPRAIGLVELASEAARRCPHASVLGLITGGSSEPMDLRAAQLKLPPDLSAFAVRCDATFSRARRRMSTLTVLDVASLRDLQSGMRTLS